MIYAMKALDIILLTIGYKYLNPSVLKLIYVISGCFLLIIDGIMFYNQMISERKNYECLFGFSLNLMKYATKFTLYSFTKIIFEIAEELQNLKLCSSSIHGEAMKKECQKIKLIYSMVSILAVSTHLVFSPFIGDEKKFLCQTTVYDSIIMKYIIMPTISLTDGYSDMALLIVPLCVTTHLNYHFNYIISCLEDMEDVNIHHINSEDMEYQEIIGRKLEMCIQHHIQLKRLINEIFGTTRASPHILILSLAGITSVVSSISFIIYEISPQSNFRMILFLLKVSSLGLFSCFYGQQLTDQSIQFHQQLSQCQWIYWNKRNRISLVIALSATAKPINISCLGLYDLNRPYLLTLIRAAYSLLAVAVNMQ